MQDALLASDAAAAASLSAGFGWPHRVEDWASFLRLGQGVAWREHGALLGTAILFPLDARHAAIGGVQVAPALQGRGIGRRLMQALMDMAGPRNLKLHATAEGLGLYARLGFQPSGTVEQWQGTVGRGNASPRLATHADLPALRALDRAATGLDRGAVMHMLLETGTIVLDGPAGAPSGYAVRRRFGRGALIGPVVAHDVAAAAALVAGLQQPGFLRLDVPAGCGLIQKLGAAGLAPAGDVFVMVRGEWPGAAGTGPAVFGLASQAFG